MAAVDAAPRRRNNNISGCRPSVYGGNLITSTGNAALDTVLGELDSSISHSTCSFSFLPPSGGGCPVGAILLIEEDKYCNYSRVLSKYFLAEAVQRRHGVFLASLEENPKQLLRTVPRRVEDKGKAQPQSTNPGGDDMRIAFRYNQLPQVDSEISGSANSTTSYDLSLAINESDLVDLDVTCYEGDDGGDTLIRDLKKVAKQDQYALDGNSGIVEKNLLRICINSFGSPLWYSDANYSKSLLLKMLQIKAVVRNTNSVCFVTVPGQLLHSFDPQLMAQMRNLVDISIEIESFAASDKETNPVFKDYHGLLHIRKLSAVDTLSSFCPETLDLAFKLKRKRFVIEKLHLPPGEESFII